MNKKGSKTPPIVEKSYKQKYDELDEKIRQHVLNKFNDEMERLNVCMMMMPMNIGETIDNFQREVVDWYEKNKQK